MYSRTKIIELLLNAPYNQQSFNTVLIIQYNEELMAPYSRAVITKFNKEVILHFKKYVNGTLALQQLVRSQVRSTQQSLTSNEYHELSHGGRK